MKNIKPYKLFEKVQSLTKEGIPISIYQALFKANFLKNNEVKLKKIIYKKSIDKNAEILAIKDEDNFIFKTKPLRGFINPSYAKYYDGFNVQNGKIDYLRSIIFSRFTKYITKDHTIYEVTNNVSTKKRKPYYQEDNKTLKRYLAKKINDLKDKQVKEIIPYIKDYRFDDNNPSYDMLLAIGNMNDMINSNDPDMMLYRLSRLFRFYNKDGYEEDYKSKKDETIIYIKNMIWQDFVDMDNSREILTKDAKKFKKRKKFNI